MGSSIVKYPGSFQDWGEGINYLNSVLLQQILDPLPNTLTHPPTHTHTHTHTHTITYKKLLPKSLKYELVSIVES